MSLEFDIAVIGGGPAGLSAAINARARNKTCIVFTRGRETSALWRAPLVKNHLGMPGANGRQMLDTFYEQAVEAGVEFKNSRVSQVLPFGDTFSLSAGTDIYTAKAIIVATGAYSGGKLPGEEKLLGQGVSYCASCDAMLYRGKVVVLQSQIAEGAEDAQLLAEVCSKLHYFPTNTPIEELPDNVIIHKGKLKEICGDDHVNSVKTADEEIPCDGVFILRPASPPDSLVYGLEVKDNVIIVNQQMETNVPGVFACGDCLGRPLQVSRAIGDGLVAGQRAAAYLAK